MVAVVFAVYICTQWQHSLAVKFTTWQQPLYTMAATVYITALKLWVGFGVGKFNCAMYHKLGCTFMPCGSYYACTVTLNNVTLQ